MWPVPALATYSPGHYQNATTSRNPPAVGSGSRAVLGAAQPRVAAEQHPVGSVWGLRARGGRYLPALLRFTGSVLSHAHPSVNFMDASINLAAFPCPQAT